MVKLSHICSFFSDYCLNRQPRPAYRCIMDGKRKYCFKIGNYCYGGHSTATGALNLAYITCVDNYTYQRYMLPTTITTKSPLIVQAVPSR